MEVINIISKKDYIEILRCYIVALDPSTVNASQCLFCSNKVICDKIEDIRKEDLDITE